MSSSNCPGKKTIAKIKALMAAAGLMSVSMRVIDDTDAVPIVPGKSYLLSRKIANDEWLLNPLSPFIAALIKYALAVYAVRHGIRIHAVVIMANHIHIVFTDMRGAVPDFMRDVFGYTGTQLNRFFGRCRTQFWAPRVRGDLLAIESPHAMIGAITYTLCNPVHHGVVKDHRIYAGFGTTIEHFEAEKACIRPYRPGRLGKSATMRKRGTLRVFVPPGFDHMSREAFIALLQSFVEEYESLCREEARLHGWTFADPRESKDDSGDNRAQIERYLEGVRRADEQPQIANHRPSAPWFIAHDRNVARQCYRRRRRWKAKYVRKYNALAVGSEDGEFPAGTWAQCRYGGHDAEPIEPFVMKRYCPEDVARAEADGRGLLARMRARLGIELDDSGARPPELDLGDAPPRRKRRAPSESRGQHEVSSARDFDDDFEDFDDDFEDFDDGFDDPGDLDDLDLDDLDDNFDDDESIGPADSSDPDLNAPSDAEALEKRLEELVGGPVTQELIDFYNF